MTRNQRNALLSALAVLIALAFGLFGGYFDDLLRRSGLELAGLPRPSAPDPVPSAQTPPVTPPPAPEAPAAAASTPDEVVIPVFDIVRVEPTGDAVIAGQAGPDTTVDILSGETVVASGKANESGEFAIVLAEPLKAGAHDLRARVTDASGKTAISEQSVDVAVPENGLGDVLVVLNQPGVASTVLQLPKSPGTEVAAAPATQSASPASPAQPARPEPEVVTPSLVEPDIKLTAPAPVSPQNPAPSAPAPQAATPIPAAPSPTSEPPAQVAGIADPDREPAAPAPEAPVAVAAASPPPSPAPAAEASPAIGETDVAASAPGTDPASAGAAAPIALATPEIQPEPGAAAPLPVASEPAIVAEARPETSEPAPVTAKPPAAPTVATTIEAVELENGKRFFAAGAAAPGSSVRLYVDDGLVADSRTAPSGRWLVEADIALSPGDHRVRVDQVAPDGSVLSRAEVPFSIGDIVADTATPPTAVVSFGTISAGGGGAASTSIGPGQSVIIRRGDNLWTIAKRLYGHGLRFSTIYEANNDQIRNPNLIYPGQVFVIPEGDLDWPSEAAPVSRGG